MPVRTLDVENIHPYSAQDLGGLSLAPGERVEVEVSDTNAYNITHNVAIKVHSESEVSDASQVAGPQDPEAVEARLQERAEARASVNGSNNKLVRDGLAYPNAAAKATQLGIDLNEVEQVDTLDGRYTLQDLIRHVAVNVNGATEGVVEGGARSSEREGEVLVAGAVANYRPRAGWPTPVQDGEGKPAQEGHSIPGVIVNTEGYPAREKNAEAQRAVGSQDEHKAYSADQERHSESEPHMGVDVTHPEGDQTTRFYALGVPQDQAPTVGDVNAGYAEEDQEAIETYQPGDVEAEAPEGGVGRVQTPEAEEERLPAEVVEEEEPVASEGSETTTEEQPADEGGAGEGNTGDAEASGESNTESEPEAQGDEGETPEPAPETAGEVRATPSARQKAEELGVDLSEVRGTGQNGAILVRDVERAAQNSG